MTPHPFALPVHLFRRFHAPALTAAALLVALPGAVHAQAEEGIEPPAAADSWKFSLGLGVVSQPRYPGSDRRDTRVLPIVGANYGRYFVGGLPGGGVQLGVGAVLLRAPQWSLGVGFGGGIGKARKESDDSRLRGLGDIDPTLRGSLFGSYSAGFLALRGNVSTDLAGKGQGTLASLEIGALWQPVARLTLGAGPGLTWADRKYTQTFFGIDAAQAAASQRAVYSPSGGINNLRFAVGAEYGVTPQWQLGVRATAARLQGDAGRSPITASRSQNTVAVFGSYRF
jgi:MipA family protein